MNKREFYGILDDFSKAYGVTIELIEDAKPTFNIPIYNFSKGSTGEDKRLWMELTITTQPE